MSFFLPLEWFYPLTLKSKGLFLVATGVETKPSGPDTNEAVKSWIKQELEAQVFIGLNVSSNIAKKVANCKSASQMLIKLETLYGKKSDLTIKGLQRKFFGFKYDTSKTVIENCMIIQQYAEELAAEGEEVKDSWIMTRILEGCRPSFIISALPGIMLVESTKTSTRCLNV